MVADETLPEDEAAYTMTVNPEAVHLLDERRDNGITVLKTPEGHRALWSFYCYSWAVEVYAVVSLTLFLPVALEQYAREAGGLAADRSKSCLDDPTEVCQVNILGWWMNTASFSLYSYSISVALQALTVIAISKQANSPSSRKSLLILFTLLGSTSCVAFLVVQSRSLIWPVSALLTISGNVAFGASIVCLNAYLPTLAKSKVESLSTGNGLGVSNNLEASIASIVEQVEEAVVAESVPPPNDTAVSKATSHISSRGIGAGYAAGIILLLFMLIPVTLMKGSMWSLRIAIAASGVWWLMFSIPAFIWLPKGPSSAARPFSRTSLSEPWTELWAILRQYKRLPETFKYLLAWFVMSDAFATITSTAILFAKTSLDMDASSLIFVGVLTPIFGIVGAIAWPKIQESYLRTTNLGTLRIIVTLAVLVRVWYKPSRVESSATDVWADTGPTGQIPIYGLVALRTPTELLAVSCYFGALYGSLQSYSRAVFAPLIPPNEEARFFALYSITDKSSSFIGPALIALITDVTGSVRYGFGFLVVALLLPLPILGWVDVDKGGLEASAYNGQTYGQHGL